MCRFSYLSISAKKRKRKFTKIDPVIVKITCMCWQLVEPLVPWKQVLMNRKTREQWSPWCDLTSPYLKFREKTFSHKFNSKKKQHSGILSHWFLPKICKASSYLLRLSENPYEDFHFYEKHTHWLICLFHGKKQEYLKNTHLSDLVTADHLTCWCQGRNQGCWWETRAQSDS